jgi:hypothetical protein
MFNKQFSKENLNYLEALLFNRKDKLYFALHHVMPHTVSLGDCDEVNDELAQVLEVLGKIRKQKEVV